MADGTVTYEVQFDDRKAQSELSRLTKRIEELKAKLAQQQEARLPLLQQAQELGAQLDTAREKLYEMENAGADESAISRQKENVAALESEWVLATRAVESYDRKILTTTNSVAIAETRAGELAGSLVGVGAAGEQGGSRAASGFAKLENRLIGLAKRVFIFSVITRALRSLKTWLSNTVKSNAEAAAAISNLKGALLTLAAPIINIIIPAFIKLVNVLTKVITAIAAVVSELFGGSLKQSSEAAKGLNEEEDALEGVGGAAKDAAKSMAGFDEINTLDSDSGGGGGGGGASGEINPSFNIGDTIETEIARLELIVGGASLVLGAILTFTGANLPLGIALMAIGAASLVAAATQHGDSVAELLRGQLGAIYAIVSAAALVVGAILVFTGANLALGIALLVLGAAGLATTAALNWDKIKIALQGSIGKVVAIVSAALLVIGAILVFAGVTLALGITLMALGAAGLATTAVLNWNSIIEALQGPMGHLVAILSVAFLVVGAILAFSGVGLAIGITLMSLGAVGLASVITINWDTLRPKIVSALASLLAVVSGASLVLGVLLCLTGAGIGIGLALIAAGLAGSVAAWNLDDNPITRFVKNIANGIIGIINTVIDAINELFHINFQGLKIGAKEIIPAFDVHLVNIPNIPALAMGAVIPPNREFLAVLGDQKQGTNIEAPLETIVDAFRRVMGESNGQPIILQLDRRELGRAVVDVYGQETQRVGLKLGGA